MEQNPPIRIRNPIILFKLLRNFGHLIQNLGIDFSGVNVKICAEIENYLAQYCSDSLQRFSLMCNLSKIPFDNLKNPLKKVKALKVITVLPRKQNLIHFLNEINLPNVQHVIISSLGQELPISEKGIHYKNIEYFTIRYYPRPPMDTFPFSFGNLKHFTIVGGIYINDALCECISNIKHLRTLKIMKFSILNSDSFSKLLRLQNILSNVEEMQFAFDKGMSAEVVICFLKQSRKLRKLTFHNFDFDHIKNHLYLKMLKTISSNLNDEWKVHIIDQYKNPFSDCLIHKCHVIERINN